MRRSKCKHDGEWLTLWEFWLESKWSITEWMSVLGQCGSFRDQTWPFTLSSAILSQGRVFFVKLNGWQRLWLLFGLMCLYLHDMKHTFASFLFKEKQIFMLSKCQRLHVIFRRLIFSSSCQLHPHKEAVEVKWQFWHRLSLFPQKHNLLLKACDFYWLHFHFSPSTCLSNYCSCLHI